MHKLILPALLLITIAAIGCKQDLPVQPPSKQPEVLLPQIDIVEPSEVVQEQPSNLPLPIQEILSKADLNKNEAHMQAMVATLNNCAKTQDCVTVYTSCCSLAYPPYIVSRENAPVLSKEYSKLFKQGNCGRPVRCPRSYFGDIKAVCVQGKCVQAAPRQADAPQ